MLGSELGEIVMPEFRYDVDADIALITSKTTRPELRSSDVN